MLEQTILITPSYLVFLLLKHSCNFTGNKVWPWKLELPILLGFPCGSAGKESACNAGDLDLIPGFKRSPGEGKGYPLQYSGLENSMDCIVHEVTESQILTEQLSLSTMQNQKHCKCSFKYQVNGMRWLFYLPWQGTEYKLKQSLINQGSHYYFPLGFSFCFSNLFLIKLFIKSNNILVQCTLEKK